MRLRYRLFLWVAVVFSITFIASFYLEARITRINLEKTYQELLKKLDQFPIRINVILRFVFQTAPPLNYTLALSGVRFKYYLVGTLLGLPLPVYIYTFFVDEIIKKLNLV